MQTSSKLGLALGSLLIGRAIFRSQRSYDLRGKVAVIAGGSRGLGLAIARVLQARGARIAICARDRDELARAQAHLGCYAEQCDVTRPDEVTLFCGHVRTALGQIDVLVNCAGTMVVGPTELMGTKDYAEAMATHFWAPLAMIQEVAPEMMGRGEGRIANIASLGGALAVPHLAPYTASKFALVGLSESLGITLAKYGIRTTTVVPGLVRTGSPRNATLKGRHTEEYRWFKLFDSLPILSMSAPRAAERIVRGIERGEVMLTMPVAAKLARLVHAILPGLTNRLMQFAERALLPPPGGLGTSEAKGYESETPITRSVLAALTDQAAIENNEIAPTDAFRRG